MSEATYLDIIGFFALMAFGCFLVFAAIAGAYVTSSFAGKIEWPHFIVCAALGGGCIWYAVCHAPFTIILG